MRRANVFTDNKELGADLAVIHKQIDSMANDIMIGLRYYPKVAARLSGIQIISNAAIKTHPLDVMMVQQVDILLNMQSRRIIVNAKRMDLDNLYFWLLHYVFHLIDPDSKDTSVPNDSRAFCRTADEVNANCFAIAAINKLGLIGTIHYDSFKQANDLMAIAMPKTLEWFDGIMLA